MQLDTVMASPKPPVSGSDMGRGCCSCPSDRKGFEILPIKPVLFHGVRGALRGHSCPAPGVRLWLRLVPKFIRFYLNSFLVVRGKERKKKKKKRGRRKEGEQDGLSF